MQTITTKKQAYTQVANELRNGNVDESLMIQAGVRAKGNEQKARAIYVKKRQKQIRDESVRAFADSPMFYVIVGAVMWGGWYLRNYF